MLSFDVCRAWNTVRLWIKIWIIESTFLLLILKARIRCLRPELGEMQIENAYERRDSVRPVTRYIYIRVAQDAKYWTEIAELVVNTHLRISPPSHALTSFFPPLFPFSFNIMLIFFKSGNARAHGRCTFFTVQKGICVALARCSSSKREEREQQGKHISRVCQRLFTSRVASTSVLKFPGKYDPSERGNRVYRFPNGNLLTVRTSRILTSGAREGIDIWHGTLPAATAAYTFTRYDIMAFYRDLYFTTFILYIIFL